MPLLAVPMGIWLVQYPYPMLDLMLASICLGLFFLLLVCQERLGQTRSIQLLTDRLIVRKSNLTRIEQPYTAIRSYNLRTSGAEGQIWTELTVYLADDWFSLRSTDFPAFDELAARLTEQGTAVPYRPVVSRPEARRLTFLLGLLGLVGAGLVLTGFLQYTPPPARPTPLVPVSSQVQALLVDQGKFRINGYVIRLTAFPEFRFYARRGDFSDTLRWLPAIVKPGSAVQVLVKEPDVARRLTRQLPLTFADRYADYRSIRVYGITTETGFRLLARNNARDKPRSRPYVRLGVFVLLALVCLSAGIGVWQRANRL